MLRASATIVDASWRLHAAFAAACSLLTAAAPLAFVLSFRRRQIELEPRRWRRASTFMFACARPKSFCSARARCEALRALVVFARLSVAR